MFRHYILKQTAALRRTRLRHLLYVRFAHLVLHLNALQHCLSRFKEFYTVMHILWQFTSSNCNILSIHNNSILRCVHQIHTNFTGQLTVTLSNPTQGSLYPVLHCIGNVAHNFQSYIKIFSSFIDFIIKYFDWVHKLSLCCWNFRYNNCIIEIPSYIKIWMNKHTLKKLQCSFRLCFKSKTHQDSHRTQHLKLCQKHSANELIIYSQLKSQTQVYSTLLP